MPLLNDHITPTGATIRVTDSPAAHLDRIAALLAEALATVPADAEQEIDLLTYMAYLRETEAALRGGEK